MNKKLLAGLAVGAMMFGMSTSSMASVIVLDFEGFPNSGSEVPVESYFTYNEGGVEYDVTNIAYSSDPVGNYYNSEGGVADYGISFTDNFKLFVEGDYSNNPTPTKVLYYELDTNAAIMNVEPGFDTGFSFYYAAESGSTITVYDKLDGPNGDGHILASRYLSGLPNPGSNLNPWDVWNPVGISFTGTAHSVYFGGLTTIGTEDFVLFDNVTLGSTTPTPEPASMMLLGTGLAGLLGARKLKKKQAA